MTYTLPTNWSAQQAAFIDWAVHGSGSCVLEAVAGSGKTTTLLGAVVQMRGPIAILAYNKKIAEEIARKLQDLGVDWKHARAGTVHSFGFNAIRKFNPNVKVDENKVANIVADLNTSWAGTICRLVSLAKQRAIGAATRMHDLAAWRDIIDHFDLLEDEYELEAIDDIINMAMRVLKASNAKTDVIDFDDMVYLPLVLPMRMFRYSAVIVDEAQDTNPARRELVKRLIQPGGRLIAVGDSCQAIYGFTGADNDSLELIARDFDARRLPLTVTYRCPKTVVAFARQWVSHIEAHESAPEGTVSAIAFKDLLAAKPDPSSAILCRNTKPLVQAAFAFIRARIPCKIEGRDIGKGLIKLAMKWKSAKTIDAYEAKLDAWIAKQRVNLEGRKLELVEGQYETMKAIIDQCQIENKTQMTEVVATVESLFADNVTGVVTLSTIHKSKGREWQTVYWLNRLATCPSRYATQDWMKKQELNLMYVSATRAMNSLIDLTM